MPVPWCKEHGLVASGTLGNAKNPFHWNLDVRWVLVRCSLDGRGILVGLSLALCSPLDFLGSFGGNSIFVGLVHNFRWTWTWISF